MTDSPFPHRDCRAPGFPQSRSVPLSMPAAALYHLLAEHDRPGLQRNASAVAWDGVQRPCHGKNPGLVHRIVRRREPGGNPADPGTACSRRVVVSPSSRGQRDCGGRQSRCHRQPPARSGSGRMHAGVITPGWRRAAGAYRGRAIPPRQPDWGWVRLVVAPQERRPHRLEDDLAVTSPWWTCRCCL